MEHQRLLPASMDALWPVTGHPKHWELVPGDEGFNEYVRGLLRRAASPDFGAIDRRLVCGGPDPAAAAAPSAAKPAPLRDQWYQSVLKWLVHPHSRVDRLLVAWQLGTGKTIGMLRVLGNFVGDPRPKIVVFPTEALVQNFYAELLRVPNPYRDWVRSRHWQLGGVSKVGPLTVALAQELLEAPTARGGLPGGPLCAFRYTIAGGQGLLHSTVVYRAGGCPARPTNELYALSNTIVLCDEPPPGGWGTMVISTTHQAVRPTTWSSPRWACSTSACVTRSSTWENDWSTPATRCPRGQVHCTNAPAHGGAVHGHADRGRSGRRDAAPRHRQGA